MGDGMLSSGDRMLRSGGRDVTQWQTTHHYFAAEPWTNGRLEQYWCGRNIGAGAILVRAQYWCGRYASVGATLMGHG